MLPSPEPPLSFERVVRSQIAGCAAYLLMIPTVAVVGSILGAGLGYGLSTLFGAREQTGGIVALCFGALGFGGAAWLGIWSYVRLAGNKIRVYSDRLEILRSQVPDAYGFDDLDWMEGPSQAFLKLDDGSILKRDHTLTIKRKSGGRLVLRSGEWPVREISAALAERAVPHLTRKLSDVLHEGRSLPFRPANLAALRFIAIGTFCVVLGSGMLYAWWRTSLIAKEYKPIGLSGFLIMIGGSALAMSTRARGGIVIEQGGIRRSIQGPLIPWARITRIDELPDAATVEIQGERPIHLGMLVRNYEVCLGLLRSRLTATG